jgi:AcrR family transcriptional regulator
MPPTYQMCSSVVGWQGADSNASLNAIAKKAGVGPGKLYRHFPSREALVLAVYRHDVAQLANLAPELLKRRPPVEALRQWFERLADYGRMKHGLADVLRAATTDGLSGETYEPVIGALTMLLDFASGLESLGRGWTPTTSS